MPRCLSGGDSRTPLPPGTNSASRDATGLSGGDSRLPLPPERTLDSRDATGLSGGDSCSPLPPGTNSRIKRCHRLVRWRFTLAATPRNELSNQEMPPACPVEIHARRYPPGTNSSSRDATGLSGGGSRLLLKIECPIASSKGTSQEFAQAKI